MSPSVSSYVKLDERDYSDLQFRTISPRPIDSYLEAGSGEGAAEKTTKYDSMSPDKMRSYFGEEEWFCSIEQMEKNGSFSYIGSGTTGRKGTYRISLDYVKSQAETVHGQDKAVRVGFGVRVVAQLETKDAGLTILDIQGLKAAFASKSVKGSIKVNKIGIESKKMDFIKPPQGSMTSASLDAAADYIDKVSTAVKDSETTFKPYILAIGEPKPAGQPEPEKPGFWKRVFGKN